VNESTRTSDIVSEPNLNQWMFESSPDCVKVLDLDGRLLEMNRNGRCVMEVDDVACLVGHEWPSFWPEASHADIKASLVAARSGQVGRFSAFCPTVKGTPKWWDVTVTPVHGDSGRVEKILAVSRDITPLQVAKEMEHENAARLQFILEAAQVGEWELDLATGKARTSLLHDRCFGYTEPVTNWSMGRFGEHVHPADRQGVESDLKRAAMGREGWRSECRVIWPDRSVHWICAHGNIYRSSDARAGRMVGTVTDITSRKRAEAFADGQRLALEQAVSGAPLPMILDVLTRAAEEGSGETVMASVMLLDGKRLRHGSAPSLPPAFSKAIDGVEIGPSVGSCGTAAFSGKPIVVHDIENDPLWAGFRNIALSHGVRSCWSQPILSVQGKVLGTLAVYRGECWTPTPAERESMELLLNTTALVLDRHQQAAERQQAEAELRQMANELARSDRRKTEFIATLAHELRNPLAPILSGLELMKTAQSDLDSLVRIRDMMARQVLHMSHLVDDLLDVARITKGTLELRKEPVAVQDIVAVAIDTSRPLIETGTHVLDVQIPDEPLMLEADPTRIVQMVSNLLNNAAKYTPSGGHINLVVDHIEGMVRISIIDNGVGLPSEALSSVFEMFVQVHKGVESAQGGLGIGLTLVKQVAELHGGAVTVTSPGLGYGCTFSVQLPLLQGTVRGESSVQPGNLDGNRGTAQLRILVVDDNVDAAEVLVELLQINGHEVRVAHDGFQALELAEAIRPEVVFLDVGMPGMNGFEVATTLRAKPQFESTIIVALTGWGAAEDRARSKAAGFDHHLTKPTNFDDIETLLASLASASAAGHTPAMRPKALG
jgi:PAS domain S-box-containing protein